MYVCMYVCQAVYMCVCVCRSVRLEVRTEEWMDGWMQGRIYVFDALRPVIFFSAMGSCGRKEGRKCFYLTTHSTHCIYGYMASDIWLRTMLIVRKEGRKCFI